MNIMFGILSTIVIKTWTIADVFFFYNYDIKISLYDFESPYVVLRIIVFFTCSAGQLIAIRFFEDSIEQPYLKEILTLSTYLPMHQTVMGHYSNDSALVSYVSSAMRNIYLYIILLFIYIYKIKIHVNPNSHAIAIIDNQ